MTSSRKDSAKIKTLAFDENRPGTRFLVSFYEYERFDFLQHIFMLPWVKRRGREYGTGFFYVGTREILCTFGNIL
jgi:hypothetical protein